MAVSWDDAAPRDFAGAALVVVLSREKGARSDLGYNLGKTLQAADLERMREMHAKKTGAMRGCVMPPSFVHSPLCET